MSDVPIVEYDFGAGTIQRLGGVENSAHNVSSIPCPERIGTCGALTKSQISARVERGK